VPADLHDARHGSNVSDGVTFAAAKGAGGMSVAFDAARQVSHVSTCLCARVCHLGGPKISKPCLVPQIDMLLHTKMRVFDRVVCVE
jgi:hypothetical protein